MIRSESLQRHVSHSVIRGLVVLTTCTAMTGAQTAASSKQRLEDVDDHLSRYVVLTNWDHRYMHLASQIEALHVPAVSMAAIRNGQIDWAAAYGVTSLGGEKATARTLFGAASISKPITAVGVLKLVEEGRIDLDTDVNRYLKRWKIPENTFTQEKKVTVRELLNHTSGIGTHNGELYDPAQPIPTFPQLLDGDKPAKTPPVRVEAVPGSKFAYSNGGYLVLALDQWIRHRMRAIQLKQWRRGMTAYRELLARGARLDIALMVAGNMRRLWHNSGTPLNGVLDLSWADQLGIPRLC